MKSSQKEQDMKEGVAGKTTTTWKRKNRRALRQSAQASPPFCRSHLGDWSVSLANKWQREKRSWASDGWYQRRWFCHVKSCLCVRLYRRRTTSDCLRRLNYSVERTAIGLTTGGCEALWVGGHGGRRVRSPHSQIKSAVTDYHQSLEVGGGGVSATDGQGDKRKGGTYLFG